MGVLKKARGFTLSELTFVLAIIAVVTSLCFNEIRHLVEDQRSAETVDAIRKIYMGSVDYYKTNGNSYTGVSLPTLCESGYVNADICDNVGIGNAPWGGDYAASSPGSTQILIWATEIPLTAGTSITRELQKDLTIQAVSYDRTNAAVEAIYYSNAS